MHMVVVIGVVVGRPQPLWAFLMTLIAFGAALAGASILGTTWIGAALVFFGAALLFVSAKSRGYAVIALDSVLIAPIGDMGRKVVYLRDELRAVELGEEGTLVFSFVADGSRSFGPWVAAWGGSTGMKNRSQAVVDAFRMTAPSTAVDT